MKTTKKRNAEFFLGMLNDIAENIPMGGYSKDDLIECIKWQRKESIKDANRRSMLHLSILDVLADDLGDTYGKPKKGV